MAVCIAKHFIELKNLSSFFESSFSVFLFGLRVKLPPVTAGLATQK